MRYQIAAMHSDGPNSSSTERALFEAIARQRMVTAVYNGGELRLAPHSIFARHGALFVTALNLNRSPRAEEEVRLGVFKLAGLSNVVVTDDTFDVVTGDPAGVMRPDDELVFAI